MPSLYAPMNGVNTKQKTVYALMDGINTKQKNGYALMSGVNTKIFSSVNTYVSATLSWAHDYSGSTNSSTLTGNNLKLNFYNHGNSSVKLTITFREPIVYSALTLSIANPNLTYSASSSGSSNNIGRVELHSSNSPSDTTYPWTKSTSNNSVETAPNPIAGSGAFSGVSNSFEIVFSMWADTTKGSSLMQTTTDMLLTDITICGVPLIAA